MNRRSFLRFLPAAALGGRRAAAEVAEKLALGSGGTSLLGNAAQSLAGPVTQDGGDWARKALAKLADPTILARRRRNVAVSVLDPDLASMHSMSLSAKIGIQRDRNFERELDNERSYLESVIAGLFD